jgi:hypothetical protein
MARLTKYAERDWQKVKMSPAAQELYERVFQPAVERLSADVSRTPLSVLIWGPGKGGGKLYKKRLQIRGELRDLGMAAVFSEEVKRTKGAVSMKADELFQAVAADFIVLLQGSPGTTAEAHDFGSLLRTIGSKMLVFVNEDCQDGYSFKGALKELNDLYRNVNTFSDPRDLDECNLLAAVVSRVRVLQTAKWRAGL